MAVEKKNIGIEMPPPEILIEVYGKSSYGDDPKQTTNSTHQPHPKTVNW